VLAKDRDPAPVEAALRAGPWRVLPLALESRGLWLEGV
jgi:hypothetical protein